MTVFGIVSETISDQTKHIIGQSHDPKFIYSYTGSIVNNGTNDVSFRLFIQSMAMGQSETSITIPAGVKVRFKNLKFNAYQSLTDNPNLYLLAVQYLKPMKETTDEEPEIFYE